MTQARPRQAHDSPLHAAVAERLRLGRLLVDSGVIDEATLQAALASSRASGRKLGEALVEGGAISTEVLARFLRRQRRLTALAMASLALFSALPDAACAGDRASVHIGATVLPHASIDVRSLPRELAISAQDVANGYVDVEPPVEIGVRSNHAAGVRLSVDVGSSQLAAAHVRAAEGALALGQGRGIFVPQEKRGLHARTVKLRLRLKLAPRAAPGVIPFPVTVSLSPL